MKTFEIPDAYRSGFITSIKKRRMQDDKLKKDFSPTVIDFGPVKIMLARHFGFCYGVENAIEKVYAALDQNPHRKIYLLSEVIHNPHVNKDLRERGIRFIMSTSGEQLIPWSAIQPDDIVIVPAFGTTLEIEQQLASIGIAQLEYNSTCPFVEKVWNRAGEIGKKGSTVIIHGRAYHEETKATFSHSSQHSPTVMIKDMKEAELLGKIILGTLPAPVFYSIFEGKYSPGFNVDTDLIKVGVVNQTTMLATETLQIAEYIREIMRTKYGTEEIAAHFADTRDTLCYATNDNQQAVRKMLDQPADLAIVVGGYNSSNTSHLVELCEEKLPTYFIAADTELLSAHEVRHWDIHTSRDKKTYAFLPDRTPVTIQITSGASCPDIEVERVVHRLLSFYNLEHRLYE